MLLEQYCNSMLKILAFATFGTIVLLMFGMLNTKNLVFSTLDTSAQRKPQWRVLH